MALSLPVAIKVKRLEQKINPKEVKFKNALWLFNYPFRGGVHYRVGTASSSWQVRKIYEAHLYPPGTTIWERVPATITRANSVFIMFKDPSACLQKLIAGNECFARFHDPGQRLGPGLKEAAALAAAAGEKAFWDVQGIFYRLISYLQNSKHLDGATYEIQAIDYHPIQSGFAAEVNRYLTENLAGKIQREALARRLNMSVSQLSHRFKKETGQALMKRLKDRRLALAKELLLKGESLKVIAAQTGFTDSFHLSKVFKTQEKMAPKFFKQRFATAGMRKNLR
jgi:AraC-like DNA-binding protein